ncbi:transcriptional regulator with XRE-family HTH domain [Sphingomonas kyeonggiensis]|uniref:helix-turn-helix domain-containing protein n=1 Tax=Sphingomonas kyeonggiensis TaxID=1268553 RepID=UPI002787FC9B|nr:helix-turn-helix transcriptional regulator [Sphingomonas kyeonggiensis]MDQ0250939.1 transcriptional regulator with XRE-family HTH domain [Sphingomonas kyeonggiensis]
MVMSPGTYIRKRREAQGLSIDDVAGIVGTVPHLDRLGRVEWLCLLEADKVPITADVVACLAKAFPFDGAVLHALTEIHAGEDRSPPQLCRICACSDRLPCRDDILGLCTLIAPDLCNACPVDEPGEGAQPVGDEGDTAPEPDHSQGMAA